MPFTKPEPGKPLLVELDGHLYEFRFTLRALKALDVEQNISIFRDLGTAFQDPAKIALILWYGLRAKNPDITLDFVEDNIDATMLLDLVPLLSYAASGRVPDVDKLIADAEARIPNALTPRAETGSPSGQSGATILAAQSSNSGS